jgi:hypothetical protein
MDLKNHYHKRSIIADAYTQPCWNCVGGDSLPYTMAESEQCESPQHEATMQHS